MISSDEFPLEYNAVRRVWDTQEDGYLRDGTRYDPIAETHGSIYRAICKTITHTHALRYDNAGTWAIAYDAFDQILVEEIADFLMLLGKEENKREVDVFMPTYGESCADRHFDLLKTKCPRAKRVNGIKGIYSAHKQCADLSETKWFYVVDADNEIGDFNFTFRPAPWDEQWTKEACHLWQSYNAVTGDQYGYGGVKLFNKSMFADDKPMPLDMTTSFPIVIHKEISSTTRPNFSAYNTWRSAFREGVKLRNHVRSGASQFEFAYQLHLDKWLNPLPDAPYARWCALGANDGINYCNADADLNVINDPDWLHNQFKHSYADSEVAR